VTGDVPIDVEKREVASSSRPPGKSTWRRFANGASHRRGMWPKGRRKRRN